MALAVANFNMSFWDGFLAIEIQKQYGVPNERMGFVFLTLSTPYFLSCAFMNAFLKRIPNKLQFVLCLAIDTVATALMGHNSLLRLPGDKLWIVLLGMGALGTASALVFIPIMPEMIESFQLAFGMAEGQHPKLDNELNDLVSGLTTQVICISTLIGPLFGGMLYDNIGFSDTMSAVMFFQLAMAALLFSFNCGFNVFVVNRER